MSAADRIHGAVKNALVKDGWTITDDPFTIQYGDVTTFADLAAEKTQEANDKRVAVIEIKSFINPSRVNELESALGQYQVYRGFLEQLAPDCELYMAISSAIYASFFQKKGVKFIVERFEVALIVVDIAKEEIVQWIS